MLELSFRKTAAPLKILCLGAHADDIEIGCGGTIFRFLGEHKIIVHWVVFCCPSQREKEARNSAESLLKKAVKRAIEIREFRDGFFPYQGDQIKEFFEELKGKLSPDLIFTHARSDLHQDHRIINELTWNTFRDHIILEYEIPKYDGDLGSPNVFIRLNEETCKRKIEHVLRFFQTQSGKHWFDEETFRALMRLRGVEAGTRYAEAFYCRKFLIA
jgi:LmbE family N-acetylglucosaminyl deacetylase